MNEKIKNIIITIAFNFIIFIFLILNIISPKNKISVSERRALAQFPTLNVQSLLNGQFSSNFDDYSMDQFYKRDEFRKLKIKLDLLLMGNYNNIANYNDYIFEILYPLNENSVLNLTKKINNIRETYLTQENRVYYSIIPDKSYYIDYNNLKLDYTKMISIYKNNIDGQYIDLFNLLSLNDYYKTDTHWRQEKIYKVASHLANEMQVQIANNLNYNEVASFSGVYSSRMNITNNDKIYIATNDIIDNVIVTDLTTNQKLNVYNLEKLQSLDKYDIYLNGAMPLIKIENPQSQSEKSLIIFRDSYTSSLAPLLSSGYKSIILVDTRYISPKILGNYINFTNQDILFLYGVIMLNNSYAIR